MWNLLLRLYIMSLLVSGMLGEFQPVLNCDAYHSGILDSRPMTSDILCGWMCQRDHRCKGYVVTQESGYSYKQCTMYSDPQYSGPFESTCEFVLGSLQRPLLNIYHGEVVTGKYGVVMAKINSSGSNEDPCQSLREMCCQGIQSAIGCESEGPMTLQCSGTGTIYIHEATYGRTHPYAEICSGDDGTTLENTSCTSTIAKNAIVSLCQGQKSCVIGPSNTFFEDNPCNNTRKYVNVTYECDCRGSQYWWPVYRHSDTGSPISGSKEQLLSDIRNGSEIKIILYNFHSMMSFYHSDAQVDPVAVYVKGGEEEVICAQSKITRRKMMWDDFDYQKYFQMVCSNGQVQEVNVEMAMGFYAQDNEGYVMEMEWYTHRPFHPIKLNTSQQNAQQNADDSVIEALNYGSKATLFVDGPIQRIMYTSTLSLDEASAVNNVWALSSNRLAYIDNGDRLAFEQSNLHYLFEGINWQGDVSLMPWYFEQKLAYGNPQLTNEKVTWYLDDEHEWDLVYHHNENGDPITGSIDSLISAFQSGHNIRVQYTSPDNLTQVFTQDVSYLTYIMPTGSIAAQMFDNSQLNVYNGSWGPNLEDLHTVVQTTGYVEVYHMGHSSQQLVNQVSGRSSVKWFIDTKKWQLVYAPQDQTHGSMDAQINLRNLVKAGASIRVVIENQWACLIKRTEISDYEVVIVEGQHIDWYAGPTGMSLHLPLTYVYSIINTYGWRTYDKWLYGENIQVDGSMQPESIEWFATF